MTVSLGAGSKARRRPGDLLLDRDRVPSAAGVVHVLGGRAASDLLVGPAYVLRGLSGVIQSMKPFYLQFTPTLSLVCSTTCVLTSMNQYSQISSTRLSSAPSAASVLTRGLRATNIFVPSTL